MTDCVSNEVIALRLRRQVIDYLETLSRLEEQLRYQTLVPAVSVPAELINQWEDWVDPNSLDTVYTSPVVSPEERQAMSEFQLTWQSVIEDLPAPLPELTELVHNPHWKRLRQAAQTALDVFMMRGRNPSDVGATNS